jgi:hypothetical protein
MLSMLSADPAAFRLNISTYFSSMQNKIDKTIDNGEIRSDETDEKHTKLLILSQMTSFSLPEIM